VGDKQNRDPAAAQLVNLAHTALAEIDIAYSKRLVYQQYLGIYVNRNGERKSHEHAARVGFHRLVDELTDLGEPHDVLVFTVHLAPGETDNGSVQVDVVASRELRVEPGTEFEQGGYAAVY